MPLYFITGNENKFKEVKSMIPGIEQLDIDLPEIQETDPKKVISAKILEAFNHHEGEFIVDDTSLSLDCLNGLPGTLIKWFLQTIGSGGLYELTQKYVNNKCHAKAVIGYAKDKNNIHFFEGMIEGTIQQSKGNTTFGWDPIFVPNGFNKSFAEMSLDEKNSISHRHLAIAQLKTFLENQE